MTEDRTEVLPEQLELVPEENPALLAVSSESVKLAVFKCERCGCIEPLTENSLRCKTIMENGYGLAYRHSHCRKGGGCYCHTGFGQAREIKVKFVDYGDVPFD